MIKLLLVIEMKLAASVLTFFTVPPAMEGLTSSPLSFLFDLDGLEEGGVPLGAVESVVLEGVVSRGSSLGRSFCFGASTGEGKTTSSSTCSPVQLKINILHKKEQERDGYIYK